MAFGDFVVKTLRSYNCINEKLSIYRLARGESRTAFDPEGYIARARASQKLSPIAHRAVLIDDLIRNLERDEAVSRKEMHRNVERAFEWKLRHRRTNIDLVSGMTDPLSRALKLLEDKDKILSNVPDALLQERALRKMVDDREEREDSYGERPHISGNIVTT